MSCFPQEGKLVLKSDLRPSVLGQILQMRFDLFCVLPYRLRHTSIFRVNLTAHVQNHCEQWKGQLRRGAPIYLADVCVLSPCSRYYNKPHLRAVRGPLSHNYVALVLRKINSCTKSIHAHQDDDFEEILRRHKDLSHFFKQPRTQRPVQWPSVSQSYLTKLSNFGWSIYLRSSINLILYEWPRNHGAMGYRQGC